MGQHLAAQGAASGYVGRSGGRLANPHVQVLFCVVSALLTRAFVFGDPAFHIDEDWYLFVGHRLLEGDRLYVDIWDRKPPGLFYLYALFAALPRPIIAYQLAACLAAAGGALLVLRMALRITTAPAAFIAAALYLASLVQLGGAGGQSPVFYNVLMAGAAALVGLGEPDRRKQRLAMLLAGFAITIKPTVLFEGAFLGLWIVWRLWRSGMAPGAIALHALQLALIGALPFLLLMAWFVSIGDFEPFWQATVLSNFVRANQMDDPVRAHRMLLVLPTIAFPAGCALLALLLARDNSRFAGRAGFLLGWIAAATLGVVAVPNFYNHYLLPLLPPLCVTASAFFGRSRVLLLLGVLGAATPLIEAKPWNTRTTRLQAEGYAQLLSMIRENDPHPRLLVFQGPATLYMDLGVRQPTPLAFAQHLDNRYEKDVSLLRTSDEVRRILAGRPTTVVIGTLVSKTVANFESRWAIQGYAQKHCQYIGKASLPDWLPPEHAVFSRCR